MPLIVEGLMTTLNVDGSVNIAPLGPVIDEAWQTWRLRPFQTARTFANLRERGCGVFHVTDDVSLLAHAAVGAIDPQPAMIRAAAIDGWILADACRWYALRVNNIDNSQPRAEIDCDVVDSGRQRDFFGFNRAKHAVVEAAILATRVGILPGDEITRELERLFAPVQKTGGQAEQDAFEFLSAYIRRALLVAGDPTGGAPP